MTIMSFQISQLDKKEITWHSIIVVLHDTTTFVAELCKRKVNVCDQNTLSL